MPGTGVIKGRDVSIEHLRFEEQYAILSADQYSELKTALKRQEGVDFVSAPRLTTLSGRQAQISVTNAQTIVTDQTDGSPNSEATFGTEAIWFGTVVDLTPVAIGNQWQLRVVASYSEFLGYRPDDSNGDVDTPAKLRARFRVRDAATTANVRSGDTLLIRGVPITETRRAKGGLFRRGEITEIRKRLYVFVTPETID
jgi:type II secretory pathway component GspD/PulD (secretin)